MERSEPDDLIIEVCSRDEAGAILTSPDQLSAVSFLISISDADMEPPLGYDAVSDKVRLLFVDADDDTGPSEDDVRRIIEIAQSVVGRSGRIIIHCLAGISRSTATAIILRLVVLGPGREREAVAAVIAQRPIARPNRRMITFADRLLGLDGRLIAAVAEAVPRTNDS